MSSAPLPPVQVVGQGERGAAQPQAQAVDLRQPAFDHTRLMRQRYLSLPEAAEYLRFPSPKAFWMWAKRAGLRPCKAGRLNLYRREDLEGHVERSLGLTSVPAVRPRLVRRAQGKTELTRHARPALPDATHPVSGDRR